MFMGESGTAPGLHYIPPAEGPRTCTRLGSIYAPTYILNGPYAGVDSVTDQLQVLHETVEALTTHFVSVENPTKAVGWWWSRNSIRRIRGRYLSNLVRKRLPDM
jgi:hypothetical protein